MTNLDSTKELQVFQPIQLGPLHLPNRILMGSMHTGGEGTIPSTIAEEKAHNPFARIDHPDVMQFCGPCDDRHERMRLVRKGKDDWGRRC